MLKILEEWLKNYQNINQADNNDEKVIKDVIDQELVMSKQITPYDNVNFCTFIYQLIDTHMLSQNLIEEAHYY